MRLRKLSLEGFGRFAKESTIEFSEGLNVIKGPNESGKSTILSAIVCAFFKKHNTGAQEVLSLTTWGKEKGFRLALTLQDERGEEYQLEKEFGRGLGSLAGGGKELSNPDAINERVAELTGCPDEDFFLSTACIRQGELSDDFKKGGSVTERLRNVGGGQAGVDMEGILAGLHSEATSRAKDASGPAKRLDDAQRTLSRLEEEIARFTPQVQDILNKRKIKVDNEVKLAELKEIFDPKKDVLQKNLRLQEITGELTKLADENDRLEKALTCRGEIKKLEEELGELPPITEMEWENIKKTYENWSHIAASPVKAPIIVRILGAILSGFGLTASLAGAVWGYLSIYDIPQITLVISGAIMAVIGGIIFLLGRKVLDGLAKKDIVQKDLETALIGLGVADFAEVEEKFKKRKNLESDLEKERARLDGSVGDRDSAGLDNEKKHINIRYSSVLQEKEGLLPYAFAEDLASPQFAEELERREKEVTQLESEANKLNDELKGIDYALLASQADPEHLTTLEEEQEELQKRIAYYQDRCEVLKLTEELLRQAHQEVLASAVPMIEEELSKYISTITAGRYREVKMDADTLSINALAPESGEMVSIEELSTATQDQFYLVARLGFLRHLTGGVRPPLILDDITANFDPVRREATRSILEELSKDYQVLLFTCHDYHDDWGRLIELEG